MCKTSQLCSTQNYFSRQSLNMHVLVSLQLLRCIIFGPPNCPTMQLILVFFSFFLTVKRYKTSAIYRDFHKDKIDQFGIIFNEFWGKAYCSSNPGVNENFIFHDLFSSAGYNKYFPSKSIQLRPTHR